MRVPTYTNSRQGLKQSEPNAEKDCPPFTCAVFFWFQSWVEEGEFISF